MPDTDTAPLTPVTIGKKHEPTHSRFESIRPTVPSIDLATPNPAGRMIIDLIPTDGGFRHYPVVRFEPVGYFTSGLMEHHTLHFCQEIERAQAAIRAERQQREREEARLTASNKEHTA